MVTFCLSCKLLLFFRISYQYLRHLCQIWFRNLKAAEDYLLKLCRVFGFFSYEFSYPHAWQPASFFHYTSWTLAAATGSSPVLPVKSVLTSQAHVKQSANEFQATVFVGPYLLILSIVSILSLSFCRTVPPILRIFLNNKTSSVLCLYYNSRFLFCQYYSWLIHIFFIKFTFM